MGKPVKIEPLFRNLKISTRLLILFLLVAIVPLGIAGTVSYINSVETIKQEVSKNLGSQVEFRSHKLIEYFDEKIRDLTVLAGNPYLSNAMTKYISAFISQGADSPVYNVVDKQFREYFTTFKEVYKYYDIFLISPEGDIVFTIALENDFGTNLRTGPYSNSLLATVYDKAKALTLPEVSEFRYYPPSDQPVSFIALPVMSQGELLGVLAAQIGTSQLEIIGHDYSALGESGEIVLAAKIGDDAVFIKSLRHDPDAAFKRKAAIGSANAVPIQKAVIGGKGYGTFLDYRGIDVLAAWLYVSELKWGLVVKIDVEEAFAPISDLKAGFLIIGIMTLLGVGGIAMFFSRTISTPITDLTKVTELMTGGDLTVKADASTEDEIGTLGSSFNIMIDKLHMADRENKRRDWLKTGQNILSEKMRGDLDISELADNIISFLAEYLDAKSGAFYLTDNSGRVLNLTGSYAFNRRENFNNRIGLKEGLAGQAAYSKKMISLTEIPEKYIRISSATIDAVPGNLVIIPVILEGETIGVIELAAFKLFSDTELEFLSAVMESIAIVINSAQSRTLLNELLENTQAQAVKLESQQEELRASNEELEASEEELKTQQEELQTTNEELEEKTLALEKQKEEVLQKNLALQKTQEDLKQKAKELELTGKYKSEFLANMSHELRTPLNSLLVLAQYLVSNKDENLNKEQLEAVAIIQSSGEDLLNLIDEILDLSKIEAGRMTINIEKVILSEVAGSISANFKHLTDAKGLELAVTIDEAMPESIRTDRQRLDQVIRNLISNAIKFTKEGSIKVDIRRPSPDADLSRSSLDTQASIAISVSDTGIGIPEDKHLRIFEAFQQVDGSTSRQYGGTGLGLSITRELVKLLGGEIHLKSFEDKGSKFIIYLPEDLSDVRGLEVKTGKFQTVSGRHHPAVDMESRTMTRSTPSIEDDRDDIKEHDRVLLVIEDDLNFAQVLYNFSHERGFKCIHCGDGETGLKFSLVYKPDAIILDMKLPGIKGWDVLETLKNNPLTRHIPVHIMSVMDETIDAYKSGAIGYIRKPASMEQLQQTFTKFEDLISRKIKNLLIVEDNEVLRKHIVELVGNGDVKTCEVWNGKDAIEEIKSNTYDCMILDLILPDISGFDVLKKLDESGVVIPPVIIYTGRELTREEEYKLQEYASSIIIKGVRSEERLLDETALFLHRVVDDLPQNKKEMISRLYDAEAIFKGRKILIVDDDMRNVFAVSKVLEAKGMDIHKAPDGQKALDILDEMPDMDLVLMDIMMPVMDGYETIGRIRSLERFEKLPIIAVTAKAMREDYEKCIAVGANDYLPKPIKIEKLLSLMRVWLYGKKGAKYG